MVESYADLKIALRWIDSQQGFDAGLRLVQSDQNVDDRDHVEDLRPLNLEELAMCANRVDSYAGSKIAERDEGNNSIAVSVSLPSAPSGPTSVPCSTAR
jgi:hypothetical protein